MVLKAPIENEGGGNATKRLLFSKPSWSKSNNLSSSELFHRSEQIYIASAAEIDRKRRAKKARKGSDATLKEVNAEPAKKRQCMTKDEDTDDDEDDEDEDDGDSETDEHNKTDYDRSQSDCFANAHHAPLAQTTEDKEQKSLDQPSTCRNTLTSTVFDDEDQLKDSATPSTRMEHHGPSMSTIINIDDEEDPAKAMIPLMNKVEPCRTTADSIADEFVASDDEFPELARKAREKARSRLLEEKMPVKNMIPSSFATCTTSRLPFSEALSPPDPVLQILITSSIPNTTPLIVSRKLSQRLKDVRLAWADRQNFPMGFTQHVFLTWRGKRLFDVTTCKSLGVRVDTEGRVLSKEDVLGDEEGRIHMEAMTSDMLESRRKAKTEEAAGNTEASEMDEQAEKKIDSQIRIILKAKGFEDFKLRVKATTLVSKILNAFRNANDVNLEREVYIMFEGQRLEPGSTIEDAEVADLDTLDTYVK